MKMRPGKRSPDERNDIRGGVGVVPDVAALIRLLAVSRVALDPNAVVAVAVHGDASDRRA